MYRVLDENKIHFDNFKTKTKVARECGITLSALSRILHKKVVCSKALAYYITKLSDADAEIADYFERIVYIKKEKQD